jgi:ribonuclease P protein component
MPDLRFRPHHRLQHAREFQLVHARGLRASRGFLALSALPTDRAEHRLGLAVGRRVGNAVVRARCKRLVREAFRLDRADLPRPSAGGAYDLVVAVRPHQRRLTLDEVRAALRALAADAHAKAERGARRAATGGQKP